MNCNFYHTCFLSMNCNVTYPCSLCMNYNFNHRWLAVASVAAHVKAIRCYEVALSFPLCYRCHLQSPASCKLPDFCAHRSGNGAPAVAAAKRRQPAAAVTEAGAVHRAFRSLKVPLLARRPRDGPPAVAAAQRRHPPAAAAGAGAVHRGCRPGQRVHRPRRGRRSRSCSRHRFQVTRSMVWGNHTLSGGRKTAFSYVMHLSESDSESLPSRIEDSLKLLHGRRPTGRVLLLALLPRASPTAPGNASSNADGFPWPTPLAAGILAVNERLEALADRC